MNRDFSLNNLKELAEDFMVRNGMYVETVTVSIELVLAAALIQGFVGYDFIVDRDMEPYCWKLTAEKDGLEYGQFIRPA